MGEMKPMRGPWVVEIEEDGEWANRWPIITSPDGPIIGTDGFYSLDPAQDLVHAHLCAEAGTVFHTTGLSPVQLVEQRDELEKRVWKLEEHLKLIAKTAWVDAALDPQRAIRIAADALAKCEGVGNE
jgi:hypothetical protein